MMSYLKKSNSFDDGLPKKRIWHRGHRLLNCGWRFVERNSGGGIQVTACLSLSPNEVTGKVEANTRLSLVPWKRPD